MDVGSIDKENQQKFEKIAVQRLIRKLDWRLIPFLFVLEMGLYINRNNIGHAKLMGMDRALHLSQTESEWAAAVFFLAYLIFIMPSIFLMRYLGPASYLPVSMFAWGGITIGMAFVRNARELVAVRFILGMAQAGFFPTIVIYVSLWYRKRDHTIRIAILLGAAIISGALGSIMADGFGRMEGLRGLHNWQWMFLLEGLPMIPLGIITCLFLSNLSDTVQWLNINEKHLLTNILREDTSAVQSETGRLCWRQVRDVFIDWRIYLYASIGIGILGVIKYFTTYLPSLVLDVGSSSTVVHLMAAPPYVAAFVSCLLAAYSSAKWKEHGLHLALCLSVSLLGFILLTSLPKPSDAVRYVLSCAICSGVFSAYPILLSWLTHNVNEQTKRSVALGFVMGIGQIGGVLFPLVNADVSTSQQNNFICLGVLIAGLIITMLLRACLAVENRRRVHFTSAEGEWHAALQYAL